MAKKEKKEKKGSRGDGEDKELKDEFVGESLGGKKEEAKESEEEMMRVEMWMRIYLILLWIRFSNKKDVV